MNRFPISLLVLPGNGQRTLTVTEGTTIGQLFEIEGLTGRSPLLNGSAASLDTVLSAGMEIAALTSVKGA